ncbi:MAG: bifunctional folylpolyglutamate synthase/dihydrofolate synthase [Acidobacteriota bacterium]|nr:bifunctional folylpolyglutamate synthase/dihydrofolate synthase [Acidobacteriota bacterium]
MNYSDSVRFLYSLGNELKTAKFGLENITVLLEALGSPHRKTRFVHVAGTNGKGSTCAMIESGLRTAGLRTGLYTSPHLHQALERIQIAGIPVTPEVFAAAFDEVHACAERLIAAGKLEFHPTYFETATAMAFLIFSREAEMVVLETGLGGRLDATNVVAPELCVITPVDFDHEAFLGNTLGEIASEKAGILKPGVPAVIAEQRAEAMDVFPRYSNVRRTSEWPVSDLDLHRRGSRFRAGGLAIECPLAGAHQVENARTAAMALTLLGIGPRQVERGIAQARWPGRLEWIASSPDVIVDGAHNPAGARALAAYIREFFPGEPLRLIYGAMRDKAISESVDLLFPLFAEVIVTAANQPRAVWPESIRELSDHPRIRVTANLLEAKALLAEGQGTVFVTGSLFLVGEARELWRAPDHTEPLRAARR